MSTYLNSVPVRKSEGAPFLAIVVPCYNEEEVLPLSAPVLLNALQNMVDKGRVARQSTIVFVDDGSKDSTWDVIEQLHRQDERCTAIGLAHNEGHQTAVYAGLMRALDLGCDAAVSIDADLQDDVSAIERMVDEYAAGAEIVYGVRDNRDTDTAFKRRTAQSYYRFMERLGTEVVYNSADFRLMGSRALEALSQYHEANLFLRGIVPSLGFQTAEVAYARKERMAGESKYPLGKMIGLAADGVTSFSTKPMHWIMVLGGLSLVVALIMLIYALISWASGAVVDGWSSLIVSIWLVGGLTMVSLGIAGEYIGKIYLETKHRPRYMVDRFLD